MNDLKEKIANLITYGFTVGGIAVTVNDVKSVVFYVLGIVLLFLRIRIYHFQLKKAKKEAEL